MKIDFSPELWRTIYFCVSVKKTNVQDALHRETQEAMMDVDFTLNEIAQEEEICNAIMNSYPNLVEDAMKAAEERDRSKP